MMQIPITIATYFTCDKTTSEDSTITLTAWGVLKPGLKGLDVTLGPQVSYTP